MGFGAAGEEYLFDFSGILPLRLKLPFEFLGHAQDDILSKFFSRDLQPVRTAGIVTYIMRLNYFA